MVSGEIIIHHDYDLFKWFRDFFPANRLEFPGYSLGKCGDLDLCDRVFRDYFPDEELVENHYSWSFDILPGATAAGHLSFLQNERVDERELHHCVSTAVNHDRIEILRYIYGKLGSEIAYTLYENMDPGVVKSLAMVKLVEEIIQIERMDHIGERLTQSILRGRSAEAIEYGKSCGWWNMNVGKVAELTFDESDRY